MSETPQRQDAKASLSKPPKARLADGLRSTTKPGLKDLLVASEPQADTLTPPRPERRHRAPLDLE